MSKLEDEYFKMKEYVANTAAIIFILLVLGCVLVIANKVISLVSADKTRHILCVDPQGNVIINVDAEYAYQGNQFLEIRTKSEQWLIKPERCIITKIVEKE